jgi:hypothetical protein
VRLKETVFERLEEAIFKPDALKSTHSLLSVLRLCMNEDPCGKDYSFGMRQSRKARMRVELKVVSMRSAWHAALTGEIALSISVTIITACSLIVEDVCLNSLSPRLLLPRVRTLFHQSPCAG